MSATSAAERGRKRSREEKEDGSPHTAVASQSRSDGDDSIAHFLALHSPPPKLARTALKFVSRRKPASNWHTLPDALIPLICQHLSSWRDLQRLCRVHRCFDECIRGYPATATSCWSNVAAIRLRIDRTVDGSSAWTSVSINDRQLLDPSTPGEEKEQETRQRQLFRSLRFVPRLSWSGRTEYAAPLVAVLPQYASLRHLHLHSLTAPTPTLPATLPLSRAWPGFRSLVSLTLDSSYDSLVQEPSALLQLRIAYLSAPTDLLEGMLSDETVASSALASTLTYIHCSGSTHWLSWALPLLPRLQHVHEGERTAGRWEQSQHKRIVSHKRPAVGSAGGSIESAAQLVSYWVRRSEELLHSRLTFPTLVCLTLHGKELLELRVLLTLSTLPALRQLTLGRRPAWSRFNEERALPLASSWLPQLSALDYLDAQCEQSVDDDWLTDLLHSCVKEEDEAAMGSVRQRLRYLGLQLPDAVNMLRMKQLRIADSGWPELLQCCLTWTTADRAEEKQVEAWSAQVTDIVVGANRACTREQLMSTRVDRQWISSAGFHDWKPAMD